MTAAGTIDRVFAWEALDSRGNPTVACEVSLRGGARGAAIVPSGASTGTHEAREVRDGDERYGGRGVTRAVANARTQLAEAVIGLDAQDQPAVDRALREADGTSNLARLGANAVLSISIAAAIAGAARAAVPLYRFVADTAAPLLPMPMINIISGGAHAGWSTEIQDILVVPVGASSFAQALEWGWRVRRAAAELVAERGLVAALIADEGGLGPPLESGRQALEIVAAAIARSGLAPGADVGIAIDVAATQLVHADGYRFGRGGGAVSAEELTAALVEWAAQHPIVSIEDPLGEDDWQGWVGASAALGDLQLLGDDLFVTDSERLARGIDLGVANAILIKPNQNGTLTGAGEVVRQARKAGYGTVLSARSGETEDHWLADLAVGWRSGQIKVGSTMRSERNAKWNRLLRIEAELGLDSEFAGAAILSRREPPRQSPAVSRPGALPRDAAALSPRGDEAR